jgi:osmotically-inducible protein OsmY
MPASYVRRLVAAFVLLLLAMAPGLALSQQGAGLTDQHIKSQVEQRCFDAGLMGVVVDVHDRAVTLSGTVGSLWLKDQAIQQARKVHAVVEVISTLTVARGEGDGPLAREVADDVSGSPFFTIFDDVAVHVADGVATLTGFVTVSDTSKEFVKLASRVRGVQQVVNRIETLPASMMDDDLRMAIAAGIYNSPVFSSYATQRIGPVHIIVRRGQVTLTGVVASEVERRMAEMIARSAFGAKGVDNQLRLEP